MLGSVPDLLRLAAVPVLGWAAWRDVKTRRVPNRTWYPLAALGLVVLVWEFAGHLPPAGLVDWRYFFQVSFSVGFVLPLSYGFWRIGGFGGADAKALMTLAVVYPTFPAYYLPTMGLPRVETTLGVFSMTVLTNTVFLGVAYPLALAVRNAAGGDLSKLMVVGRRLDVAALPNAHGRLFEDEGGATRRGLDLDALRMYLRWRGTTLDALRTDPDRHRDPASIGETFPPSDGAVRDTRPDGGATAATAQAAPVADDPWGAEAFLDSIEGTAYGTDPETLREGLEVVASRERVWISPGIPFLVPMFLGLVAALTYGDLLFGLLGVLGVP